MSPRGHILVTGFGPYPHVRINPTASLAQAIAAICRTRGIASRALVLETSYGKGLSDLARELDHDPPAAMLMLGLAPRSRFVRVETLARAGASWLHVDVAGHAPEASAGTERNRRNAACAPGLPLRTTAAAATALAQLRRQAIDARLSCSAGRYLCNTAYSAALRELGPRGVPVLFIHIPYPRSGRGIAWRKIPRPAIEPLRAALSAIAIDLGVLARRRVARLSRDALVVPWRDTRSRHGP